MYYNHLLFFSFGIVLLLLPVSILLRKINRMLDREKEATKSPFSEKLLRAPGESLRLKIEDIRDQMGDLFFKLGCCLLIPCIFCLLISKLALIVVTFVMTIVSIPCYILGVRQWRKIKVLREQLINYRLGFDGERYVAAELMPLLAEGYQVFHDFIYDMDPGGDDSTFNIDHIAVGPEGVFVIETKAKRKSTQSSNNELEPNELCMKGKKLQFPNGTITGQPIEQAERHAEKFQRWIAKSGVQGITVRPLVVYPGWYVKDPRWKILGVQSARNIAQRIPGLGKGRKLSSQEIQIISARIEDKCRDIEGSD